MGEIFSVINKIAGKNGTLSDLKAGLSEQTCGFTKKSHKNACTLLQLSHSWKLCQRNDPKYGKTHNKVLFKSLQIYNCPKRGKLKYNVAI